MSKNQKRIIPWFRIMEKNVPVTMVYQPAVTGTEPKKRLAKREVITQKPPFLCMEFRATQIEHETKKEIIMKRIIMITILMIIGNLVNA